MEPTAIHVPVLADEVTHLLRARRPGWMVDGTVGLGGHAERLLEASAPGARLLGLDGDAEALAQAGARLARFGGRAVLRHGSFRRLGSHAAGAGVTEAEPSSCSAVVSRTPTRPSRPNALASEVSDEKGRNRVPFGAVSVASAAPIDIGRAQSPPAATSNRPGSATVCPSAVPASITPHRMPMGHRIISRRP